MVLVTGTIVGTAATNPAAVALFGPAGAKFVAGTLLPTAAATEGITSIGAAILAVGEGACIGMGALGGGSSAGVTLAMMVGPVGWAVVGYNKNGYDTGGSSYTWDCWKPVVMDHSVEPSHGISLRDL